MKTIFSHAVNAIKANPQPTMNLYQDKNLDQAENGNQSSQSQSILQRIQLNKKNAKAPKSISLRTKEGDSFNDFDSSRIQKKTIQKDLRKVLTRSSDKNDAQDDWKHDDEFNPNNNTLGNFTVSLRNLSNTITEDALRDVINDDRSIKEFNLKTGRGDIIFSNKESAKRAASLLNDRILKGSKIRAQYVAEITLNSVNPIPQFDSKNVELPNYHKDNFFPQDEKEEDDQEEAEPEPERPSIFSRIQKK